MSGALEPGTILEVLRRAGRDSLITRTHRHKVELRCPLHEDRRASAVVFLDANVFHCAAGCGSMGARQLSERLGVLWPLAGPRRTEHTPHFTPTDARVAWDACLAEARDDRLVATHRRVYDFIAKRGLQETLDAGEDLVGILPCGSAELPPGCRVFFAWPGRPWDYPLVAALYDQQGALAGIQARAVLDLPHGAPKILSPKGSRISGTAFANRAAREVLRGGRDGDPVLLAEGLTDFLALAATCPYPIISVPGAEVAVHAVRPWVRERLVLVGLDSDRAGEGAANKVAEVVAREGGQPVRVRPGDVKDWCDLLAARGPVWLEEFVTWSIDRARRLVFR
jgi:hypothetical protein